MSSAEELGTLAIVVLKAKDLPDKHSFYKSDVYAQVTLNGATQKTRIDKKGGQHPVWDDEMRFAVMKDTNAKTRTIEVSCWSQEPKTVEIMGKGTLDISETLRIGEFDDWVRLTSDGGRGEVYLEMTFYSNAPPPVTSLAPPKPQKIQRRPSKLSPAERLWRPPKPQTPPEVKQNEILVGGSPPNKGRNSPLPPVPEDARPPPSGLQPAAGRYPPPQQPLPVANSTARPPPPQTMVPGGTPPSLPSALKPGGAAGHTRHPSQPQNNGTLPPEAYGYNSNATPPNPYTYNAASQNYIYPTQQQSYQPAVDPWANSSAPTGSFSFPVPDLAPAPAAAPYPGSNFYGPDHPSNRPQYGASSDLPDPYLQARYQTPLPLPPGAGRSPPRERLPLPGSTVQVDPRVQAQRAAEEDARRRKEQEERDLELARQLDQELNAPAVEAAPTHARRTSDGRRMPGGW